MKALRVCLYSTSGRLMTASTHLFYGTDEPLLKLVWHEPLPGATVPEAAVQDIWAAQRLIPAALRTTGGQRVEVLHPGTLNHDGGPDFSNARIRIGETVWFGDVEIHTTSRGWVDHGHQRDVRYNRVILHVVLQPDLWTGELTRADGTSLPELVLAPHLDAPFRSRLGAFFTATPATRPCAWGSGHISERTTQTWLREQVTTRLQQRRDVFEQAPSLRVELYRQTASALGYRPNAAPMRELALRVPLEDLCVLRSQRDREALLLGMAGLLPATPDPVSSQGRSAGYVADLRRRFEALRPLNVAPVEEASWQYARLRPANAPDLRIAQLAALVRPAGLTEQVQTLSDLLERSAPPETFLHYLEATPDMFWTEHYRLSSPSASHPHGIGRTTQIRLLVNVLLPAALAAARDQTRSLDRALDLLETLPAENDRVARAFDFLALPRKSLLHTQGLHELDRAFCQPQRCLACAIGRTVLDAPSPIAFPVSCSSGSSTSTSNPNT